MAKKKSRGIHPLAVLLLTLLASGAAAGVTYASYIKTKYEGNHPCWSKEAYRALDPSSLEHKAAEKLLKPETLAFFAQQETAASVSGPALADAQPSPDKQEEGIHIEHVSAGTYEGFMIVVPDPKDVAIVINPGYDAGAPGPELDWYVDHFSALAGINGGGFEDAGGRGDGSIPQGLVIQGGKIVHGNGGGRSSIVGLDKNGNLITAKVTGQEALDRGVVEAVTFGPTFIENGKVVYTSADAGTLNMLNPRTAMGQKKDGTMLLLVVDGRGPTSFGAQYEDIVKIFKDYEAVNAGNLDGGNSSVMIYDGAYANYPVSMYNSRNLPSVVLVKGVRKDG
jgi:exopolysaccharide biosynthesis protein